MLRRCCLSAAVSFGYLLRPEEVGLIGAELPHAEVAPVAPVAGRADVARTTGEVVVPVAPAGATGHSPEAAGLAALAGQIEIVIQHHILPGL
jgi:hypothetical protein